MYYEKELCKRVSERYRSDSNRYDNLISKIHQAQFLDDRLVSQDYYGRKYNTRYTSERSEHNRIYIEDMMYISSSDLEVIIFDYPKLFGMVKYQTENIINIFLCRLKLYTELLNVYSPAYDEIKNNSDCPELFSLINRLDDEEANARISRTIMRKRLTGIFN